MLTPPVDEHREDAEAGKLIGSAKHSCFLESEEGSVSAPNLDWLRTLIGVVDLQYKGTSPRSTAASPLDHEIHG